MNPRALGILALAALAASASAAPARTARGLKRRADDPRHVATPEMQARWKDRAEKKRARKNTTRAVMHYGLAILKPGALVGATKERNPAL